MRQGWQILMVDEACQLINGGTPKSGIAEYWDGDLYWITPAEMGKRLSPYVSTTQRKITELGLQNSSARMLPPHSVILSSRAPIGHLVVNTAPMAFNQGCKGLIPKSCIHYKFLYYYLYSIVEHLDSLGTGATFRELSGGKLKEVNVPVPPLPEQQRIVALLDEAFACLATAKANAEQNLQNARALFESHLQSIFANQWLTGELVTLRELATDITDGDHLPPPKSSTGVPFITIGNILKETREIDFTDTFMVPRAYFDALKPHKKPRQGDVLYTVTGSFGIPVIVRNDAEFCFQRHIGLVRPKPETSSSWLYYLLMSPQLHKQANDGATGTAQKTVSLTLLRSFVVPKVSSQQQKQAVEKLDALTEETQRLTRIYERKLTALEELKKSLLHQAFNGEL
jgi:type I restriction enzyme S subunit